MKQNRRRRFATTVLIGVAAAFPVTGLEAQRGISMPPPSTRSDAPMKMAEHSMSGAMDSIMMKHMELSATRRATPADSTRALAVVKELRAAIAKYRDTATAVADGYAMFAPGMKHQKTYHFTKNGNALLGAFTFSPGRPTSLLYEQDASGKMTLVGAMYTMPKRASLSRLNDRIPLSIARWHRHVNWCLPAKDQQGRWTETKNGMPVFGPESPIVTQAECDIVGGRFEPTVFGWMVHANVFAGDDLGTIFADHHQGGREGH